MTEKEDFWQAKSLSEMNRQEWESLCDGCGKCCLVKLQDDEDEKAIYDTDVACKLLDISSCRCSDYAERKKHVPDCVQLTADNIATLGFMPESCAYRLLSEGKDLPWWHHLVCGDRELVHQAGASCRDRVICETEVDDAALEDHIVTWTKETV